MKLTSNNTLGRNWKKNKRFLFFPTFLNSVLNLTFNLTLESENFFNLLSNTLSNYCPLPLKYNKVRISFEDKVLLCSEQQLKMTPAMPIIIMSTSQHLQQKHAFYIQHVFILTLEFTVQYSVYFLAFSRNSIFRKQFHT